MFIEYNGKILYLILCVLLCFYFSACEKTGPGPKENTVFANDTVTEANVTYSNFMAGLLKTKCATCHAPNGSAASWWINTNTYSNCSNNYQVITRTLINMTMPPPPKFPITKRDRLLIKAWIKRGLP